MTPDGRMNRIEEKLDALIMRMDRIESQLARFEGNHEARIVSLERRIDVSDSRGWMLTLALIQSALAFVAAAGLAALRLKGGG